MPTLTAADLASTTDHTDMLIDRAKKCLFPTSDPLVLPRTKPLDPLKPETPFICYQPLPYGVASLIMGAGSGDDGTKICYRGPADQGLLQMCSLNQSRGGLRHLCIVDERPDNSTNIDPEEWLPGDYLLSFEAERNGLELDDLKLIGRPGRHARFSAPSGYATDMIRARRLWLKNGGIMIERARKTLDFYWTHCDTRTPHPVFTIRGVKPDGAQISIRKWGHEVASTAGRAPWLYLPSHTYGNVALSDGIQCCPQNVASDIVEMANSRDSRLTVENVVGELHQMGASGSGIVYKRDTGERIYGPVRGSLAV